MDKFLKINLVQIMGDSFANRSESRKKILDYLSRAVKNMPDIVVFPECSFPSYALADWNEEVNVECLSLIEELKEQARKNNCYLVIGLPEASYDGTTLKKMHNALYVINPLGEIEVIAHKQLLWHFDSKWFDSDKRSAYFDTKWGRIGLMICADGRAPEIVSSLKLLGCRLILNGTNWVTSGADPERLSNPQADYLMSVRAREQEIWIASANKVGMEDGFIVFCGKSMVTSPSGEIMIVASSNKEEIVEYMLPLCDGEIDVPQKELCDIESDMEFDIGGIDQSSDCPRKSIYVSVAKVCTVNDFKAEICALLRKIDIMDVDFAVVNVKTKNLSVRVKEELENIEIDANLELVLNVNDSSGNKTFHIFNGSIQVIDKATLFKGNNLRLGIVFEQQGIKPHRIRTMVVNGMDALLWYYDGKEEMYKDIVRARAMESRIFVLAVDVNGEATSLICGPDGNIMCESFFGGNQIIATYLDLALSDRKIVVPGTDIEKSLAKYRIV